MRVVFRFRFGDGVVETVNGSGFLGREGVYFGTSII